MRVDVHSDVSPITGEGEQGEQLARNMLECCERDADVFWNTELFGRTFRDMVCDGLREKTVPPDAREKLRRALTRIVNEGRGRRAVHPLISGAGRLSAKRDHM